MPPIFLIAIYVCVAVGVFLVVDALAGFLRVARGADDDTVERRLTNQALLRAQPGSTEAYSILRPRTGSEPWSDYVPFYPRFLRLLDTSGTGISPQRAFGIMAIVAFIAFILLALLLPLRFFPLAFPIAPFIGIGLVLFYLMQTRKARILKFEEQLPDAIDLIVRSLKIGHPLSGAMSVVGRELQVPISTEFSAAFEQVTYGQEIPAAFAAMAERVPLQDLGYLSMAIQIQQESGGNLVESLSKLSTVIRGRFRMFRKVKALTAEGRFSAWFLSIFPFALIFIIQLIKPDYYTQVMNLPVFPYLVGVTLILLTINVIAMRIITKLKV
jgi:tight adherence protein B